MHKRRLTKPDGRALLLYGREPIPADLQAPSAAGAGSGSPNAHLRWHPLLGEWVAYAGHRQNRTFLPPKEYNPLAVTTDPAAPTELPAGRWDVADGSVSALAATLRRAAADIEAGTPPIPDPTVRERFRQSSRTAAMLEVYRRVTGDLSP